MTAPLFHLAAGALAEVTVGARVLLDGPEGRHAAVVRRIGVGEAVLLADGTGRVASGSASEVGAAEVTVTVHELRDDPPPSPRIVLVQALAKDHRDLQAVEAATELGVDAVVPWQAERSIVQWRAERAAKARAKWANAVRAAAKQSRRARVPEVGDLVRRGDLAEVVEASALTLVLHEEAREPIGEVELPASGEVQVVVGPEGGIGADELEILRGAGARLVRLGPTVLRASTAGPAAIAVLASRSRW